MKTAFLALMYQLVLKPVFFKLNPDFVHERMLTTGNLLGASSIGKSLINSLFYFKDKKLSQKLFGVIFENPIGLSAGFDYDAQLTQILPSMGFGFGTVGTVTNIPYGGNPRPMLGRLPKSRSLLVNKGFKSKGADKIAIKLYDKDFLVPLGISVGRSNSPTLGTLDASIEDIATSFKKFEKSKLKNAYYELNISCPNLIHGAKNITFYPPKNLRRLLTKIDKLKLSKPLFIKMPITETSTATLKMLSVIVSHKVMGVIIGNLQKDRANPAFDKVEVKEAGMGNFSGKPCQPRSNELIALTSKKYGRKLVIIGCGGVFNARDAYEKIKLGASLVMMITGMVYEGPQVVGKINKDLLALMKVDGYKNISEAVGVYTRF